MEKQLREKTLPSWHRIYQLAPTTIRHVILSSLGEKLCQNRHHRTSKFNRAELEVNSQLKDSLKSIWTILVPCPLSNARYKVWDTHRRASQVPRSFLCENWVVGSTHLHSITRPRRIDPGRSNTLDSAIKCYGKCSVIGRLWGGRIFRSWGDISQSPATWKLHKLKSWRNTTPRRGNRTSAVIFRKKEKTCQ